MYDYKLGIVGAGNMASAILNGILRTGVISPEKIVVSDIDDKKLKLSKSGRKYRKRQQSIIQKCRIYNTCRKTAGRKSHIPRF